MVHIVEDLKGTRKHSVTCHLFATSLDSNPNPNKFDQNHEVVIIRIEICKVETICSVSLKIYDCTPLQLLYRHVQCMADLVLMGVHG